ncbi:Vacuolar protein 8 [Heracleum sosnowskyi]|uniref:Vacuolar protein 8 n=1 Tax=Heracleum sosnowskyi TaxID=360622 RepID=A0AAD8HBS0_9APIA|nr:Vacuolar protein 8 [Heracleum sosnowskyi]
MSDQNSPEFSSPPAEKSRLRQAVDMISTLITLSYTIKVFTAKWYMIRNRLQDLLSDLVDIDKRGTSSDAMLLSGEVIQAIIDTVFECNQLGKRCIESTYNGKFFMQSDLYKVVCVLDTHIKYLSDIYTVGLCIFVEKPGILASKDGKKVYVNDLLSRLKIGDAYMKKEALVDLNQVIQEDEQIMDICVKTNGIVSVLVSFLDSEVIDIREESAKAVCEITKYDVYRRVLASAGMIPPLIRVLECGSRVGQEFAARCLVNITEKSNYAWSILAQDGLTVLLKIGRNIDAFGSNLVVLACEVLKNLSGDEEINKCMVEHGALEVFIELAKSKDEVVLLSSINFLQIMACRDEFNRDLIVKGGIFVLLNVLDPKVFVSSKAGEMAFVAIKALCMESTIILKIVMDYGFLDHMFHFLQNRFLGVQDLALKALIWLCESETSEQAKEAMGDAGFIPELVKFLDAKSIEFRVLAAKALSGMMSVPKNRKIFMENQENVGLLVKLLEQEEANSGEDRKFLLSILMSITSTASGRKIVRRSASSKLSCIFTGKWR